MLLAALLLAQTVPCRGIDENLPPEIAGWNGATAASLVPGHPFTVETTAAPTRPSATGFTPGGRFATIPFTIEKAGRYRIAIAKHYVWVDLTPSGGGERFKPVGPYNDFSYSCSTIFEIETFDLKPGAYDLSLSILSDPTIKVMLVAARSCDWPSNEQPSEPGEEAISSCTASR